MRESLASRSYFSEMMLKNAIISDHHHCNIHNTYYLK